MVQPPLVLLPIIAETDDDDIQKFKVLTAEELLEKGFKHASAWFYDAENRWDANKTDKNVEMKTTLSSYLNWQNKITEQNPKARFLVLYTSSATDASAVVIDRRTFDHPFIVDHKTYWCECASEVEANYVAAYINSGYANAMIKEFQSRGLFGPRDIHKLIVKLPFPKFEKSNETHLLLSALGKECAKRARSFAASISIQDLQARALGRARTTLRDELSSELEKIDAIVEPLSTGKAAISPTLRRKSRKLNAGTGRLFD